MSPVDAAAAVFGHIQHGPQNSTQHSHVTNNENICFNTTEATNEDTSATALLLKKFASFIGTVIHEFGLGETLFVQPIADIHFTAHIVAEMITSLISSFSKLPVEDISLDSLSEHQTVGTPPQSASGIAPLSFEMLLEDDNARLDYSITQMDVLRMSRVASRRLRVDSVDQLPTTIYHEEQNELICSSHETEREEELSGDIQLPVVTALQQGDNPEFSWLIVPEDPCDGLTRISKLNVVPESISICSSNSEKKDRDAFDHCVICQEPFQEGENLRVLPCEHLFHSGCIDKMMLGENLEDDSGCPMCKKNLQEPQGESHHSDGSVPSWSFKRLGSLLASMSK